jgi:SpoVK/Ycf46/Vps4 family AAA+-type ATPase
VCVVLPTNRPDLLEPALAARPGRVDLAVELPLPDGDCRRRLFQRFAQGLELDGVDVEAVVARTDGVTASFFRELDALLEQTGEMTRILLGARAPEGQVAPSPAAWMARAARLGSGGQTGILGPPG